MNKAGPVVAIVILALVVALLILKFSGSDPVRPPVDNSGQVRDIEFKADTFIPTFDVDGDGQVTLDEFKQRYGKPLAEGEQKMVMHDPKTGEALTAEDAFQKHWDRTQDGVVNRTDFELIKDREWADFYQSKKS